MATAAAAPPANPASAAVAAHELTLLPRLGRSRSGRGPAGISCWGCCDEVELHAEGRQV